MSIGDRANFVQQPKSPYGKCQCIFRNPVSLGLIRCEGIFLIHLNPVAAAWAVLYDHEREFRVQVAFHSPGSVHDDDFMRNECIYVPHVLRLVFSVHESSKLVFLTV